MTVGNIITRVHCNDMGVYTVEKMAIDENGVYHFALYDEGGNEMLASGAMFTRDTNYVREDA